MNTTIPGYGMWGLAAANAAFFIFFAWSFYMPLNARDWRSFGLFSAFVVALFAEMYGFPLSLFLLSGWLSSKFPGVHWLSHDAGHVFEMMFGWRLHPHLGPFHIASFVLIGLGFWLLSVAWPVLYRAQRDGRIAHEGIYARIRHPQYVGFFMIMTGFLLQWPTLLTLAMYPVLIWVYARLSIAEERDSLKRFGEAYASYMTEVPRFIPRRRRMGSTSGAAP
ncbi:MULTISPECIES: methyltransferase family protein [Rhodanobacter]|uniref:methyltransferase family protein n=1 Tax=Rhodanobacter TaxID=75309 RepID=UPI000406634E|nr:MULTISPECIES: isoprenylcysteine carboxylmethyltransferase family protein [Rhodanobacter]KZC18939.1 isoprenylcysteine carboxyl methyltransferase [Rhodanobacter denitrificans]UJM95090.1 isoprenylcysteine carboxylmethyltransferase family protein [Rhodanobacter denitrificans]UJM98621.1 isoprenylcysteine carboxylmethyltransferase family protein [Rhodanobacter denitrificans]UJN21964.1 isoprenylcysteine carboxylmethyltransferase family protein [Rhodanobacter denitrificans]